jgi:hypothetical protein
MQGCGVGVDDKFAWYGGILGYLYPSIPPYRAPKCAGSTNNSSTNNAQLLDKTQKI